MQLKLLEKIIESPLGLLLLRADEEALYSIEFVQKKSKINNKTNRILDLIESELELYFAGKLKSFSTPVKFLGTEFQKKCWKNLLLIEYGKTISYKQQAILVGGPNFARAVANANNKNPLPIIVPCHRVIGSNGKLVGYASGIENKEYLLNLEA